MPSAHERRRASMTEREGCGRRSGKASKERSEGGAEDQGERGGERLDVQVVADDAGPGDEIQHRLPAGYHDPHPDPVRVREPAGREHDRRRDDPADDGYELERAAEQAEGERMWKA